MKANSIGNKALYYANKTKETNFSYAEYVKVMNLINLKLKEHLLEGDVISLGDVGNFQVMKNKIRDDARFRKFARFKRVDGVRVMEMTYANPLEDYVSKLYWKQTVHKKVKYWRIKPVLKFRFALLDKLKDEEGHKRYIQLW